MRKAKIVVFTLLIAVSIQAGLVLAAGGDVEQLPVGIDTQLDRAIDEVLRLHAEDPPLVPEFGPVPPRGRDAYKKELSSWRRNR